MAMRRPASRFLLFVLITLAFTACKSRPNMVNIQATWKSTDPMTIPLPVRLKESEKKNLVVNPSFESGRYYKDTTKISFNLPGWKKVGQNVFWTDIQNQKEYKADEAYSGLRSIKIVRSNSNETDNQGEGVISDFIKVIPGNYKLSFYLRLEDIEPQMPRLNPGLRDAINIRIMYYNKAKVLIHSNILNPEKNNYIDNSFKGLSFSSMNYIDRLGWGKVQGKTAHYPFNEGDISDDSRYVRIFLGLKGNGTMWVDMVNFEYSDKNYSLLESTQALFDTIPPDLIPTPQEMSNFTPEPLKINVNDKILDPLILVPANADPEMMSSVQILINQINSALRVNAKKSEPIGIVTKMDKTVSESGRLIFSMGKTRVFNERAEKLPVRSIKDKKQSYFIHTLPEMNRFVFVDAEDEQGMYRACLTLAQLVNIQNQVYYHYNIIDYPDIETRAAIIPVSGGDKEESTVTDLKTLTAAGFNMFYFQNSDGPVISAKTVPKNVKPVIPGILTRVRSLPNSASGISLLNMRLEKQAKKAPEDLTKQVEIMTKILDRYVAEGFTNFIISDEIIWDYLDLGSKSIAYKILSVEEFDNFISLRNAFLSEIYKSSLFRNSSRNVLLYPVFSTNESLLTAGNHASLYFSQLRKYGNFPDGLLWNGPVDYPTQLDFVEYHQYFDVSGKQSYLFFNALSISREKRFNGDYELIYPGKARIGSIFEAFDLEISDIPANMGLPSFCLLNNDKNSVIGKIRLMTASDFMWNIEAYNAAKSTWKVLSRLYGKKNAELLIQFNDKYCQLLQLCMIMEKEKYNQKYIKEGEAIIAGLNNNWNEITGDLVSESILLNELSDYKNQVISRFYRLK